MMSDADEWTDYRRRRNIFWLVFVTYVPGVFALGLPLQWLVGSELPIYVVAATWLIAFIVTANRMGAWKCPRCGKAFFRTFWGQNPLARKCVHCRLPKWNPPNPASV
jgi:hypothetical protein